VERRATINALVRERAVATDQQGISNRYAVMSNDDLLRVAVDPDSLTTTAREALAEELQKRNFDSPDAIGKYARERDQQIKQEEELDAAVRWSNRSRFQRIFDYLKQHPLVALLASIGSPGLAFLIGYGLVTLRIGGPRILSSLVSLTLTLGGVCGIAAVRSSARLPIRILGVLATLGEFYYAFFFLFAATIGLR
jgi:ABC-type glycerol-3-phosphate transport system permease component